MAARFEDHPRRGRRDARARRPADLRPHPRPRLPLPRLGGPGGRRARSPRSAPHKLRGALPARQPAPRRRRTPAPGGGAARDRRARPARLLPPAPRHARARARGRRRGPRPGHGARAAAARPRPRLLGVLDRLLPHRPLAHRPDRQRALPRALPQRGAHRAAGHRPRLPARHPRGPDPARARPLRARALGAGRRLPDLPLARRDPRARQGARPAGRASSSASRAGPSRSRCAAWRPTSSRALGLEPGGPPAPWLDPDSRGAVRDVHRRVAGDGQRPRTRRTRRGAAARDERAPRRAARPLGAGSRGCATRPTASRATSPSTRAG